MPKARTATVTLGWLLLGRGRGRERARQRPERQRGGDYPSSRARAHLRQVHLLQARSGLAAARRVRARPRQGRVPGGLRRLRDRSLAASVFDGRDQGRRRPADPEPEPGARGPPHLPRRAGPERPRPLGDDPPLLPGDDQALALLRGVDPPGDRGLRAQVPLRLPLREEARVVPAPDRGAPADHEEPHRGRPPLSRDLDQHRPTRSASTTRSSSSPSRPTSPASSSTWSRSSAPPSRAPTRCATPRSSPASRCRSPARSTRSTAPRPPPSPSV